jgi:hypothetical protein
MFRNTILFVLLIILTGCDIFKQYELEVVMPQLPSHIKSSYSNIKFELKYPGSSENNLHYRELMPGSSVFISTSFSVLPVVATPYIYLSSENPNAGGCITFYPAGGIFPESGKDGRLFLKWEDGFAAKIIYTMVNNGYNLDSFNMGRFTNYLSDRSSGNPWIYDEEEIIYGLAFGIFNANFVKRKRAHSIELQMSQAARHSAGERNLNEVFIEKRWLLSNLNDSRIFEESNGVLTLDNISERNVFILSETGKEFVQLFMDNNGWHAYFSNSKEILSGRW